MVAFEYLAVTPIVTPIVNDLGNSSAYTLVVGSVLLAQLISNALSGIIIDAFGAIRPTVIGSCTFGIGLLICGCAPNMTVFIIGRLIQGFGGGAVVVGCYALVGTIVPVEHQPHFFTSFATAWVLPSLIAPGLAGYITTQFSWRYVFFLVPICLILAMPSLHTTAKSYSFLDSQTLKKKQSIRTLTRTTFLALVSGSTLLIWQLPISSSHSVAIIWPRIVAAAIAIFAVIPLLALRGIVSSHRPRYDITARLLLNGAYVAIETSLPLFFQICHKWSVQQSGLLMSIGSITWAIGSWLSTVPKEPKARKHLIPSGGVITFVSVLCVSASATANSSPLFILVLWSVVGLGVGIAYPTLAVDALAHAPFNAKGIVSGALQIADGFGSTLCVGLLGLSLAITADNFQASYTIMAVISLAALIIGSISNSR